MKILIEYGIDMDAQGPLQRIHCLTRAVWQNNVKGPSPSIADTFIKRTLTTVCTVLILLVEFVFLLPLDKLLTCSEAGICNANYLVLMPRLQRQRYHRAGRKSTARNGLYTCPADDE